MNIRLFFQRCSGFVLLASGAVLGACGEEGTIPASADVEIPSCDTEIDGLTQNLTREGVRTAFLQAEHGCTWQSSDTLVVDDFRLTVYEAVTGVERAVVTGDRGVLNTTTERMRANGNAVLFIPAQGRRIESEELFYDPQANRMYSDSATVMYMEDRIVEGSGFESDLTFDNPTIRAFRTRPGGQGQPGSAPPPPPEPDTSGQDPPLDPSVILPVQPDTGGPSGRPGASAPDTGRSR